MNTLIKTNRLELIRSIIRGNQNNMARLLKANPLDGLAEVVNPLKSEVKEEISLNVNRSDSGELVANEDFQPVNSGLPFERVKDKVSEIDYILSAKEKRILAKEVAAFRSKEKSRWAIVPFGFWDGMVSN